MSEGRERDSEEKREEVERERRLREREVEKENVFFFSPFGARATKLEELLRCLFLLSHPGFLPRLLFSLSLSLERESTRL